MSPSSIVPLYPCKKPQMNEPNWPTTISPSRLAIIGNSSCCSRIPGDMAVRNSTVSISKRAFRSALSMMSIVTVSTLTFLKRCLLRWTSCAGLEEPLSLGALARALVGVNEDVAEPIHLPVVLGQDHRRRVHLDHDRGALDAVAGLESRSIIDKSRHLLAVHVAGLLPDHGG